MLSLLSNISGLYECLGNTYAGNLSGLCRVDCVPLHILTHFLPVCSMIISNCPEQTLAVVEDFFSLIGETISNRLESAILGLTATYFPNAQGEANDISLEILMDCISRAHLRSCAEFWTSVIMRKVTNSGSTSASVNLILFSVVESRQGLMFALLKAIAIMIGVCDSKTCTKTVSLASSLLPNLIKNENLYGFLENDLISRCVRTLGDGSLRDTHQAAILLVATVYFALRPISQGVFDTLLTCIPGITRESLLFFELEFMAKVTQKERVGLMKNLLGCMTGLELSEMGRDTYIIDAGVGEVEFFRKKNAVPDPDVISESPGTTITGNLFDH